MDRTKELINRVEEFVCGKEIYLNYIEDYETFASSILKHTRQILIDKNSVFNYERKGNNREGAFTQKDTKLRISGVPILTKVVKVRRDAPFASQIHTYFHELAHLVNDHNSRANEITLSKPQKEYVAETTAQALLYSFVGGMKVKDLPSNNKWDQEIYIESWIKNAKFSEDKIKEMWRQIEFAYDLIKDTILDKIKKTQD